VYAVVSDRAFEFDLTHGDRRSGAVCLVGLVCVVRGWHDFLALLDDVRNRLIETSVGHTDLL